MKTCGFLIFLFCAAIFIVEGRCLRPRRNLPSTMKIIWEYRSTEIRKYFKKFSGSLLKKRTKEWGVGTKIAILALIMNTFEIIELLAALSGVVYIWLEYRASVWLWLAGIVMPAIYIWVYLQSGVYANVGINVYFIVAGVYGLWVWLSGRGEHGEKPITHTPRSVWVPSIAVGTILTVGIWWLLVRFTDSTVPWLDAFTTGFSVIGLWMLARKWAEQWAVWIVVDAVYTGMYLHLEMWPTAAMYGIFTIVAVFGLFKWRGRATEALSESH